MREAFVRALTRAAEADPSVVLLTADLGFGVLNDYRERFPEQFINLGVAEQNLASVATGLAMTGHRIFTYSIGNFASLRCLEQIRNDVCYHEVPVTTVAVGGGMPYGVLGPSHFATEDLAILRALPSMAVLAPGDPYEVEALVPQILARGKPAYLRLGRGGDPRAHENGREIHLGRPALLREGEGVCLLTTGGMLAIALQAAGVLEGEHGLAPTVASVHTLAPVDEGARLEITDGPALVFCCEEHSVRGGLGGMVAEVLAAQPSHGRVIRFGLPPSFPDGIGSQQYLQAVNGLDAAALIERILSEPR